MSNFFLADEKWTLHITVGDVKRVKSLAGVDLLQPLPMTKPVSNEFNAWLQSGGFKFDELTNKQEIFLRAIYSDKEPSEASLLTQLQSDVILLVDVIYGLVKPQADARGLSDEQFGMRVGGEELAEIVDAFWEAYEDFFLRYGNSPVQKVISINRKLTKKAMTSAVEAVDESQLERQMDELIAEAVSEMQNENAEEPIRGENSTNVQDTSE